MKLMHKYLLRSSSLYPEKVAVIQGNRRITYGQLTAAVRQVSSYLSQDMLTKGDRVAILQENSPEYLLSYFSVLNAGGIVVPLSDQIAPRGARKVLENCTPSVVFVQRKMAQVIREILPDLPSVRSVVVVDPGVIEGKPSSGSEELVAMESSSSKWITLGQIMMSETIEEMDPKIEESDVALILYTSGTTGDPKGVMLTHLNLASNAESIIAYLRLSSKDRSLVVLPFYYSYGNSLLTTHVAVGGSLVLQNSFLYPNTVLDRMISEEVTGFSGVPSTYAILLNRTNIRKRSFPHLRYITQAGGAMSPKHAAELQNILPNAEIFIMYGQTEAAARLSYLDPSQLLRKAGSIGMPIPGVKLAIVKKDGTPAKAREVGEIVATGDNIMQGYWNNPDETSRVLMHDGLHTGDLAWMDEEGYFFIVGRKIDMIKSGAHRISPKEIEEVILELQNIHEVAVVGVEDEILGEAIVAFIVLKEGQSLTDEDVLKHCRKNLPPYKIPKRLVFLAEMPKTESGKIRKQVLVSIGNVEDVASHRRQDVRG